jgi:hypothetical protein
VSEDQFTGEHDADGDPIYLNEQGEPYVLADDDSEDWDSEDLEDELAGRLENIERLVAARERDAAINAALLAHGAQPGPEAQRMGELMAEGYSVEPPQRWRGSLSRRLSTSRSTLSSASAGTPSRAPRRRNFGNGPTPSRTRNCSTQRARCSTLTTPTERAQYIGSRFNDVAAEDDDTPEVIAPLAEDATADERVAYMNARENGAEVAEQEYGL